MKFLACALKNKIKIKFLIIRGSLAPPSRERYIISTSDPLIISVGYKVFNLRIMSREPMLTAQGTFNFWFRNRNNYNLKFQRNYNL